MARPDRGSMERERSRDMLVVSVTEEVAPLDASEPSDLAFTSRSDGNSCPREPLSRLCQTGDPGQSASYHREPLSRLCQTEHPGQSDSCPREPLSRLCQTEDPGQSDSCPRKPLSRLCQSEDPGRPVIRAAAFRVRNIAAA